MLGIWCLSMWENMGKPDKLYLIELGPGKGTLMKDIMKVSARFPEFKKAISVHFVELSAVLRRRQYDALQCTGLLESTTTSNNSNSSSNTTTKQKDQLDAAVGKTDSIRDGHTYHTSDGVTVSWHSFLQQVPSDAPVLVIGKQRNTYLLLVDIYLYISLLIDCLWIWQARSFWTLSQCTSSCTRRRAGERSWWTLAPPLQRPARNPRWRVAINALLQRRRRCWRK